MSARRQSRNNRGSVENPLLFIDLFGDDLDIGWKANADYWELLEAPYRYHHDKRRNGKRIVGIDRGIARR